MKDYGLFWSPEGRRIAIVSAETGWEARKKAPQPYRKYLGEVYSVPCDCIASGNELKPKQHGADAHAKNCAIYMPAGEN